MATYTLSSTRKRGKAMAFVVAAAGILGISLVALFVGALTGLDPGLSVRFMVLIGVPFLLVLAWVVPRSKDDPAERFNQILFYLMLTAIFWPPYALFTLRGLPSLEPRRMILLLLLVLWLFKVMTSPILSRRLLSRLRMGGLPLMLLSGFVVWRLASAVASAQPVYSFIQFGWDFLNYYLVFFVAISSLRDMRDLRPLLTALAAAAIAIALIGFVERVVGHNLFANLVPANAEFAAAQAQGLEEKIREGGNRVQATFEHPMVMAEFLVVILPMIVFLALKDRRKVVRVGALGGIVLVLGGIALSGTRSAMLTGAVVMSLSMTLYFMNNVQGGKMSLKAFFSVLGMLTLVVGLLASVSVMSQLIAGRTAAERGSSVSRLLQVQAAIPKVQKQPLLGYGVWMGNAELGFKASRGRLSVDNYYLTLTLDSGLPGSLAFLGALIGFIWTGARLFLGKAEADQRVLAGLLSISLIGLMVTKSVLSIEKNLIFMTLICAMLVVLREQASVAPNQAVAP
jgi:hypothetical protein